MSKPAPINVLAISLAAKTTPVLLAGSLTTNALHVISLTKLPRSVPKIREQIEGMISRNAAGGHDATIMMEDPTGLLSGLGYRLRLDDKTGDGRPVLALAMERYRALTAMGGLFYPGNNPTEYQISESIMNVKMGENGKANYEIDWSQLKDASRVLLLLIYGAMCQGPMHSSYLDRLYGQLGGHEDNAARITSFHAITRGYDDAEAIALETIAGSRPGWL